MCDRRARSDAMNLNWPATEQGCYSRVSPSLRPHLRLRRWHNFYGESLNSLVTFPTVRSNHARRKVPAVTGIPLKWKTPS